jgi:zinc/manganese transport system substrate-binding protein
MKPLLKLLFAAVFLLSTPAHAAINVFACEPEWGALVREIGGESVQVFVATTALQDPHHIQARPSLLAQARRADLVVCTGAELEIGWLPVVLRESANGKVQPGTPGYFEAAQYVRMLEIPTRLDRAEGDIHAAGNPHIQMDPRNIIKIAEALSKRMQAMDPAQAAHYRARHEQFALRWKKAIQDWEQQARPLKGMPIVVHHRAFVYLNNWLGLNEVAELEPKPGVEPTVSHLTQVLEKLKGTGARAILRVPWDDPHAAEWLAEKTKLPILVLPGTVGGDERAQDLYGLYEDTLQRLLSVEH